MIKKKREKWNGITSLKLAGANEKLLEWLDKWQILLTEQQQQQQRNMFIGFGI